MVLVCAVLKSVNIFGMKCAINFWVLLLLSFQAAKLFDEEGRKKFFTQDMNNILLE